MWSVPVVVDSVVLDEDFGFDKRVEDFTVDELIWQFAVERFELSVLP
jgi:hypothetical protein